MGVASEIVEDLTGPAEGLLGVDDPAWLPQTPKRDQRSNYGIVAECVMERVEVLPAKDLRQGVDREEEGAGPTDPSPMCGIESAHRDDAVQVDVEGQVLTPSVKDRDDTWLGPEMPRVASELVQGFGGGSEEQTVDQRSRRDKGTTRSFFPFPCSIRTVMRPRSTSPTLSLNASLTRRPPA